MKQANTRSGIFSVRSAYRLAVSIQNQTSHSTSSSTNEAEDHSIWDVVWKANIPEKIKIFGWRVATRTCKLQ
uniref:Uncharacterized protein n=1 Tax=Aegilops tauschii subsp. strangulata TaxID=200361 RepID=A0A453TDR2_AEGTS